MAFPIKQQVVQLVNAKIEHWQRNDSYQISFMGTVSAQAVRGRMQMVMIAQLTSRPFEPSETRRPFPTVVMRSGLL